MRNQHLKHLLLIIDSCNNDNESILFTKNDYFVNSYYYELIYKKRIDINWIKFETKLASLLF